MIINDSNDFVYFFAPLKMSEKAKHYLKHGRIFSAGNDGMCGIDFNLGELYLIAGSSPNVGICNYVKQYSKMTLVEKRGVAGGYKKGCECKVCKMNNTFWFEKVFLIH